MIFESKREAIRTERGQAMTEFALILPLLALLIFGIVQLGIIFNNYVTITDATRAGARKGAVGRYQANPCAAAEAAVRSSAPNLNQAQLNVQVCPPSTFKPGTNVTVTTTYPYSISLLGVVVKSGQLTSTTTERVE